MCYIYIYQKNSAVQLTSVEQFQKNFKDNYCYMTHSSFMVCMHVLIVKQVSYEISQ